MLVNSLLPFFSWHRVYLCHFSSVRPCSSSFPGSFVHLSVPSLSILRIKVKLATLVEGDPKAPFLIATTPRCRRRALFHSLDCSTLPLILTLKCWVLSKAASSTIFESLVWLDLGLNPGLPDHWRTLYSLANGPVISRIVFFHTSVSW